MGAKTAFSQPGVVRVTLKGIGNAAVVGDLAALSAGAVSGGIPHAITVEGCGGMVFDKVTVHSRPAWAFWNPAEKAA